jgi:hypothetical protein
MLWFSAFLRYLLHRSIVAPPNQGNALLLEARPGGETFGIVIGCGIWIGMFLFGIVYYVIKCRCTRCCFPQPKSDEESLKDTAGQEGDP